MKKLRYRKDTELWEYPADSIVSGVPVSYFDNDVDAMAYRKKVKDKEHWTKSMKELEDNFDKKKVTPVFYCLRCRRLEDGAHRILILPKFKIKTIRVRVGEVCYKRAMSAGLLLRGDTTVKGVFERLLATMKTEHKLDLRWMQALAYDKWPRFMDLVDFRGKSVMDVGCNSGYSTIMAWARGADSALGIDIRPDIVEVGKAIERTLKINKPMTHRPIPGTVAFRLANFAQKKVRVAKVDIIICFGLIHYFPERLYDLVLKKLCDHCNETLLLELRIIDNDAIRLEHVGPQTLPTSGWLKDKLDKYGFNVILRSNRPKDRELWVMERKTDE